MKIYLFCPLVKSGGPENIHQLCDYLNEIGQDAYIYYHPASETGTATYPEFKHIKIATSIEDSPENLFILPEILNISEFRQRIKNIRIAIWWLSYTNACLFNSLGPNLEQQDIIHLFHSYYEYSMVRPFLSFATPWFFVTDYIHDTFLQLKPEDYQEQKENIVCFNGSKDQITPWICKVLNIPAVNLRGLTREEVIAHLQKARLYVDMGYHPGKDHLPREAAMCGCIVVTNKSGSAAYEEDVPLGEKVRFEKELLDLLPKILSEPETYYENQETYRKFVQGEKQLFQENVQFFLEQIKNDSKSVNTHTTEPEPRNSHTYE